MTEPMTTSRRRIRLPLLVGLTILLAAGCAGDAELDTLEPESGVANDIYDLVLPVFLTAGVILVLVQGAVLYMSFKNRVKSYDDDEFPPQISHNNTLEIGWTIVPAIIMVIIAVLTISTHVVINRDEAAAIDLEIAGETTTWDPTIVVVGQQWWWEYRYYFDEADLSNEDFNGADPRDLPPADIVTSGQFAIPTGLEVDLIVTSRDVIHSHWIPRLNGKRDAVPGRFSPWKIEADDPGVYFGQCTEFCGLSHSRMRMQTVALSPEDFQAWVTMQMEPTTWDDPAVQAYADEYRASGSATVADADADNQTLRGMDTFVNLCSSCHLVTGLNDEVNGVAYDGAAVVSGSAPNLTHFANNTTFAGGILNLYEADGDLNDDDLARWIRNPEEVKANAANNVPDGELPRGMPTLGLSERQIDDVIAFLSTLGPTADAEKIQATEVE